MTSVPSKELRDGAPFTVATTFHIDSATGNDANPGTAALPWATLARGETERRKYAALQQPMALQLHGAGPYTWTPLIGSLCTDNGHFIVLADPAADTIHTTGTFTGDIAGMVIPTSAGLGADTQAKRFCRVLTGNCATAVFEICENADASITPLTKAFRVAMGAIANGDTFQIFTPGTTVTTASFVANQVGDCRGGVQLYPRHWFVGLRFTGSGLSVQNSQVGFLGCKFDGVTLSGLNRSEIYTNWTSSFTPPSQLAASAGKYASAGVWTTSQISIQSGTLFNGPGAFEGFFDVGGPGTQCAITAARLTAALTAVSLCQVQIPGSGSAAAAYVINTTIDINDDAFMRIGGSIGVGRFAVTSGDCVKTRRGGQVTWSTTALGGGVQFSGGTSDAAGFGVNVKGGGRAFFTILPTVTGGTATKDLATTATPAGVANATLSATGTTVDVLGSPYAETLSRVAA